MEKKPMCCVCGHKEVKTVMMKHWKTDQMKDFFEATCEETQCQKEYDQVMAEADLWTDGQRDYGYEE